MPQRNQRKKSLEASGKCKVNARDMLHWPNCGFLLQPPPNTTTSPGTQHNSANDVICGSAEVSPRRCRCTQLYHSGKQKRETHPFIQRSISKVPQILPAEQSPPLAAPPRSSHLSLSSSRRRSLVDWAPFQTHFSCPPMSCFEDNQNTVKLRFYTTSSPIVQLPESLPCSLVHHPLNTLLCSDR